MHCAFADQLDTVRNQFYSDCSDDDLVIIRLDPDRISVPVVVEDLGAGGPYPHLYGPLPVAEVSQVGPLPAAA